MLKNTIAEMKLEIAALHESLHSTRTESTSQVNASANLNASGHLHQTHAVGGSSSGADPTGILHTPLTVDAGKKQHYYPDKKFNIVVYGIDECSKGTPRHNRLINDVHKVVSVLSSVDTTIQSQSIKDCLRLGKFNPKQQHPRPLLVRFVRITDASNILSKRKDFYSPISIKPDMSPAERFRDCILLKERWKLIQSGVARSAIKIIEARLFVKRKLYGQVLNSTFQKQSQAPIIVDQLDMSSNRGDKSSTIVQSNSTLLSTYVGHLLWDLHLLLTLSVNLFTTTTLLNLLLIQLILRVIYWTLSSQMQILFQTYQSIHFVLCCHLTISALHLQLNNLSPSY